MAKISKLILATLLTAAVASAAGCGSRGKREKFAYVEKPAETLYLDAVTALERKRYDNAVPLFEEVERQHPYSPWARRAMLMKAFSFYQRNDYDEAVEALDQFIALHPGNKDAAYAYYLRAMCNYERIRDVGRDQEFTNNAVASLNDVVRRYPQTEYARDARLKLDLTFDHLAGKEMSIGRYYERIGKYIAAVNRYQFVIDNYQTTSHVPEALYRLVETYLRLGIVEEAQKAAAVLGHNYPGDRWYEASYEILAENNLLAPGAKAPVNKRAAKREAKIDRKLNRSAERRLKDEASGAALPPPTDEIGNDNPVPADTPFPDNN